MKDMFAQGGSGSAGIKTNKQAIARTYNVKVNEVIYSNDFSSTLDGKKIIYDKANQYAWRLPSGIPTGAVIVSLTGSTLIYNPGSVSVELLVVDASTESMLSRLGAETGNPMVGTFEGGATVTTASQSVGFLAEGKLYTWAGTLPKTVTKGSTPENSGGIAPGAWVRVDQFTLRNQLASDAGFDLIKYKKAGVNGSVLNTLSTRYAYTLDAVADFGADPTGTNDSASALLAWAAACAEVDWAEADIQGIFKTSQPILMENLTGLTIYAQAYIYPTFDTGDYVFGICNGQGVKTYGRLEVSGQSKLGVKSGFKFWSNNANGFSFSDFYGLCVSDALTGITLGDFAYPHALISELAFHGGYTVGTPRAIYAIGNQTYINFIGFNAVSGAPGGLSVATQYTLHTKGANVMFIGGELQHNDNISGATVLIEPVTDITDGDGNNYGNSYGSVGVANCHIETAAQLCMIANLDGVTSTISNRTGVSFTNLRGYHSQNNGGMITVHSSASEYAGKIMTKDIQLYCGVIRNQANIVAGTNTIVDYDPSGFGWQFVSGLQAVSGGILLFPRRAVYRAYNSNRQAIGTSPGVVNYVTPQTSDDMYRWTSNYSAGRFTVPAGGLRDVEVLANIRVAAGNVQLDVYVDSAVKSLGTPNATSTTVRVFLGNLNAGQIIDVRATASAATTSNGGDLESITIFAER